MGALNGRVCEGSRRYAIIHPDVGLKELRLIRRVATQQAPRAGRRVHLLLAILPLALVTSYVVIVRPDLGHLAAYGYAGVFALMAIGNATVLLPMPGLATVVAAGMVWNPLLVGLAGGTGGALGELVGYLAGHGVHAYMEGRRARWLQRVQKAVRRYGFPAVILLAAIPNPFFDIVGLAAGSLGYPPWRFYLAVALGNTVKCTMVAYAGGAFRLWLP